MTPSRFAVLMLPNGYLPIELKSAARYMNISRRGASECVVVEVSVVVVVLSGLKAVGGRPVVFAVEIAGIAAIADVVVEVVRVIGSTDVVGLVVFFTNVVVVVVDIDVVEVVVVDIDVVEVVVVVVDIVIVVIDVVEVFEVVKVVDVVEVVEVVRVVEVVDVVDTVLVVEAAEVVDIVDAMMFDAVDAVAECGFAGESDRLPLKSCASKGRTGKAVSEVSAEDADGCGRLGGVGAGATITDTLVRLFQE